jgi:hypothetical protein
MDTLTAVIERVTARLQRYWQHSTRLATSSGRHDLCGAVLVISGVLAPLWATPVAAQVGVGAVEQILCQPGSVTIGQVIALVFGLMAGYFFLKGLIRLMIGFDKAGRPDVSSKYLPLQIRDAGYSFAAGLLPALVPTVLLAAGITPVACLLPG